MNLALETLARVDRYWLFDKASERMKTWTAQMAGDDLLAAFYAERFTELTASGHLMQDIDLGIVAKVLERVVFYGEHLDFYLLDGSKVTVKLDKVQ